MLSKQYCIVFLSKSHVFPLALVHSVDMSGDIIGAKLGVQYISLSL